MSCTSSLFLEPKKDRIFLRLVAIALMPDRSLDRQFKPIEV
ncbi:hypothetical protein QUA13_18115 [Microcoleus sp. S28C3]